MLPGAEEVDLNGKKEGENPAKEQIDFVQSQPFIDYLSDNIVSIFSEIYEELFIDSIFGQNDSFINRDDFIQAITTNSD